MQYASRSFVSLILGVAALLSGCGKSDAPAAAAPAADGVRTVEITASDAMKYSVTEIRVRVGEKFRLKLTNLGQMPKTAMGHNWVLLKPMDDAAVLAFAGSAAAKMPEYLPDDRSAILAHTKILGGGESDTIEVTAPTQPGGYPYACTFPGHAALMKGKLVVSAN
jgi:azurin